MKPAPFEYVAASSIDEALHALADPDAKVLAGGQSLVPLLNMRLARPSMLVDVNCDGPVQRPFIGPQLLSDPAFRSAFGPRVLSTTLAVAWVAAGRRAAYVSDGVFVDNVHFAAGIGLCRAAGCIVTDLTGAALESGRGLIVAAYSETHERLVDITRPHLESVVRGAR